MRTIIPLAALLAILAAPALADHNHPGLAHLTRQLAERAHHFADMATSGSHHGSIPEIILIDRARSFARKSDGLARRAAAGAPPAELAGVVRRLDEIGTQISFTLLFSHAFEHVRHDWSVTYELLQDVKRAIRVLGPRDVARSDLFDRMSSR